MKRRGAGIVSNKRRAMSNTLKTNGNDKSISLAHAVDESKI